MADVAQSIIEAIDAAYAKDRPDKTRSYIGASVVGHPCDAMLAFQMRGFPDNPVPPKLQRVFKMGHLIEDLTVKDLKNAGLNVWEVDGLTGRQHSYEEWGGHVVCHTDGHIEIEQDRLAILEVKSMNDASFKKFQTGGVKFSHPRYFAQVQMMMAMSGIHETLFIAQNKNNQEYHAECVKYDEFEWSFIEGRITTVLDGDAAKISKDETDWRCRDCFKNGVCWGNARPEPACRNCKSAVPKPDGGWHCLRTGTRADEVCSHYAVYHPRPRS